MAFLDLTGLTYYTTKLKTWVQNIISNLQPDGVTIKNTSGKMVASDIALGGNFPGQASHRGWIPADDGFLPHYNEAEESHSVAITDFNLLLVPGIYHVRIDNDILNSPSWITGIRDGILFVYAIGSASSITSRERLVQVFVCTTTPYIGETCSRLITLTDPTTIYATYPWISYINTSTSIGDGLAVNGNKLTVPEMTGASSSAAGTSGLVPAPNKNDHLRALLGNGDFGYPSAIALGSQTDNSLTRGWAYNTVRPRWPGTSGSTYLADMDAVTTPGKYHVLISLANTANIPYNYPDNGVAGVDSENPLGLVSCFLEVEALNSDGYISSYRRLKQSLYINGTSAKPSTRWQKWERVVQYNSNTNTILSKLDWWLVTRQGISYIGPNIYAINRNITKGATPGNDYIQIIFEGEDIFSKNESIGNRLGLIEYAYQTDFTGIKLRAYKPEAGSTVGIGFNIGYDGDGKEVAAVITSPAADSNDKSIATTEWVRSLVQSMLNS